MEKGKNSGGQEVNMISAFKEFNNNQIDYLYSNDHTKMNITEIVSHVSAILSTIPTKNDLQEIGQSLEKIKANLEKKQPNYTLFFFGFKDSLTLVTECITKVSAAIDIKSKIEAKKFPELISYFRSHPEELVKNKELIKTHFDLEMLPLLFDKLSTKDLTDVLSDQNVPEEALKKLSKIQILRLKQGYHQIFDPYIPNLTKGVKKIRETMGLTDEEKDAEIARYMEHQSISLASIKQVLDEKEFLRLAPHLRYVNLEYFPDIPLAKEFLQKCSNLNVLLINRDKIVDGVTALPFCQEFYCRDCPNMQALPALPLCEKFSSKACPNLQALPALPLCKELTCYGCIWLTALPALPLCKRFDGDFKNLKALPALPSCQRLHCIGCEKLQTLPALPLCTDVSCGWCPLLQTLPALPLCNSLVCVKCTGLKELPPLPLCGNFECWGCTNLTTLPLSLGQNPRITHINIEDTKIDPAVRDAILMQCYRMRNAEAVKILPSRIAKWGAIAKRDLDISALSETQKMTLNEWLIRLERTQDFTRSQSLLANTVCNILADLVKNKEFQELFFPQAEANNACCEDRAAMSLNEIFTSWKIICAPENLKVLAGVAKTLRLRKELQKLIKGDESESVEIFLYYESTLRERLGLVTAIQNMTYGTIGNRAWINKEKLVEDVEANFLEELIELPVFEKMIVIDDMSNKLEELGECPAGGPNDRQVLNYQHRQGEIMQEWKREKMRAAKRVVL